MTLLDLAALFLLIALLLLLLRSKWPYSQWSRQGVAQLQPEFFYGDLRGVLTGKADIGNSFMDIYRKFKERRLPFGGAYWGFQPIFVPIDVKLIKDVMVKDFSFFEDRGLFYHEKDPLTMNLFRIEGDAWKTLRQKLSPTFTSSRMKEMFDTINEKIVLLKEVVESHLLNGESTLNVTDLTARFTTDIIGSCAFGIECDSLRDPDCDFRLEGNKINQPNVLKQWLEHHLPNKLLGYTGYKSFPQVERFFREIVFSTIEYREKQQIYRKDFMHFLLQLRKTDGSIQHLNSLQSRTLLTDDEILAQCFIFFVAGFHTSANTLMCALYELARKPHIQERVIEEIRQMVKQHGGKMTYEGLKGLELTERVILETLRKYPAVPAIPRMCTKHYKIRNSNVTLKKGTALQIPVRGIHMDPEYYPEPEEFDPERFSKEETDKRPSFTFLPFGEGPRVCIGARFAMMQAKAGLVAMLDVARFTILEGETPAKIKFKPSQVLLNPSQDVVLRAERI